VQPYAEQAGGDGFSHPRINEKLAERNAQK